MPAKKYVICLSEEERLALEKVSDSNRRRALEKMRARILLLSDTRPSREAGAGRTDAEIVAALGCGSLTVYQVRKRAIERGALESVVRQEQLHRKARKLDGVGEAQLVALVCSAPPEGFARWSLRLVRERLIELDVVEHIGLETIRTTLKKTRLNPG